MVGNGRTILLQPGQPRPKLLLERLDPQLRAEVLLALLAMVLVGLALVAIVVIWGNRLRRAARHRPRPRDIGADRWYAKPIPPPANNDNDNDDNDDQPGESDDSHDHPRPI